MSSNGPARVVQRPQLVPPHEVQVRSHDVLLVVRQPLLGPDQPRANETGRRHAIRSEDRTSGVPHAAVAVVEREHCQRASQPRAGAQRLQRTVEAHDLVIFEDVRYLPAKHVGRDRHAVPAQLRHPVEREHADRMAASQRPDQVARRTIQEQPCQYRDSLDNSPKIA